MLRLPDRLYSQYLVPPRVRRKDPLRFDPVPSTIAEEQSQWPSFWQPHKVERYGGATER